MFDAIQERIRYFENSTKVKDEIAKSESDRLKLEIELNKMINSDEAIAEAKAMKLKAYYNKLCDDEAKSHKRNQELLKNLARVDSQYQQLEAKLETLKNFKKEYEIYLRTAYPNFTNEHRIAITSETVENVMKSTTPGLDIITENLNKLNVYNQSKLNEHYREPSLTSPKVNQTSPKLISADDLHKNPYKQIASPNTAGILVSAYHGVTMPKTLDGGSHAGSYISLQNDSKSTMDDNSPVNKPTSVLNNLLIIKPSLNNQSLNNKTEVNKKQGVDELNKAENDGVRKLASTIAVNRNYDFDQSMNNNNNNKFQRMDSQTNLGNNLNATDQLLIKEYEREIKRQDTNMNEFTGSSTLFASALVNASMEVVNPLMQQQQQQQPQKQKQPQQANNNNNKVLNQTIDKPSVNFQLNDENSDVSESNDENSLRQDLNLEGFYRLLDHIEQEVYSTIHPERYYRQVEPHFKDKLDIIKIAREGGGSLHDLDSANITMVIQEQLPNVVRKHTKNACLFTKDLLGLSLIDINEQVIRKNLSDKKDREMFDRLLKHWIVLRRMGQIDSQTIAKIFAPGLLGQTKLGNEKAEKFIEKIVNSSVSQIDPFSESKSLTETSINKELLLASNSKLKESSAYQQFIMGSTQSSNKTKKESDDDDDIDELVAPKSMFSTNSSAAKIQVTGPLGALINSKSPRNLKKSLDGDFDFSQSSVSESQKKSIGSKQLNSLRSSKEKKTPIHLRDDFDISDDDTESNEVRSKFNAKSQQSDPDFDFYN